MATKNELTEKWIQFLKRHQIVAAQSKPDGKLNYKRKPTVEDMERFLRSETHYNDQQIADAIKRALGKGDISDVSDTSASLNTDPRISHDSSDEFDTDDNDIFDTDGTPINRGPAGSADRATASARAKAAYTHRNKPILRPGHALPGGNAKVNNNNKNSDDLNAWKTNHNPDSVSDVKSKNISGEFTGSSTHPFDATNVADIDYKEIPHEPEDVRDLPPSKSGKKFNHQPSKGTEPQKRISRWKWPTIKEDIVDTPVELGETEVERIFAELSSTEEISKGKAALADLERSTAPKEKTNDEKRSELMQLRQTIANNMTDSQRKSLWRLLKNA